MSPTAIRTRPAKSRAATTCRPRAPRPVVPKSMWTPPSLGDLTFVDMFCGAGGSSLGLTYAGLRLLVGMNHWQTAIDTHAANFTYAEHLCADASRYPLRRLPRADVLWASPICTEMSPAGGNVRTRRDNVYLPPKKAAAAGQDNLLDELGHVPADGFDKTRATHWNVVECTEIFRYRAVITENVADMAEKWELFDIWIQAMCRLGYRAQVVSWNSAHVGGPDNEHAPQWRDRIYCVFTRLDVPLPDLNLRPLSLCTSCGEKVNGVQTWSKTTLKRVSSGAGRVFLVGRYRRDPNSSYGQYWYTCPNSRCDEARVEPYIRPAATAIDWSDLGGLIGSRTGNDVLKPNTIARIKAGLRKYARPVTVNSNHDDDRIRDVATTPFDACTVKIGSGLACPPFTLVSGGSWPAGPIDVTAGPMRTQMANEKGGEALFAPPTPFLTVLRTNADIGSINDPLATVTTGNHQYLTVPPGSFYMMNYSAERGREPDRMTRSFGEPLGAQTATNSHSIVVPYYTKGDPSSTADPFPAVSTRDRFALVHPDGWMVDADIDELVAASHYRMLKPVESLAAQRFPDDYLVTGGVGAQTMQAGNAVSANCAQELGHRIAAVLCRTSATV